MIGCLGSLDNSCSEVPLEPYAHAGCAFLREIMLSPSTPPYRLVKPKGKVKVSQIGRFANKF